MKLTASSGKPVSGYGGNGRDWQHLKISEILYQGTGQKALDDGIIPAGQIQIEFVVMLTSPSELGLHFRFIP